MSIYKRMLLFMLAISLMLPFTGCQQNEPKNQTSQITIEEDPAYSAETLLLAEQTIYALVLYTYRNAVMDKIPENVEARLQGYAHRICEITAAHPVSEEQYRSVIAMLEHDGEAVIDELLALQSNDDARYEKTRTCYLYFTYVFGAEHVAAMLYDVCLLIYDAQYERTMEKFETYQYPWYLEEAEDLAAKKRIFAEGVGKESFVALIKCSTAMAELLSANLDETAETFSDAELLELTRHLDFSKINITDDGWELLISYALSSQEDSYFSKIADIAQQSGDVSRLAAVMNSAVELSVSVMKKLTPEDIASLRSQNQDSLLHSVFSRFDESDWALFASVTSVSLANDQYSALAEETYGDAYLTYLSNMEKTELSLLKESVGNANFHQNLSNYLAGICPALSYEVNS